MQRPPFDITPHALEQVRVMQAAKGVRDAYGLRVGIKGTAGCAGVSFLIGFDKPQPDDLVFTLGDVTVIMDKKHALYLANVEVDFVERPTERGFVFSKK
jgi:iron-sulfur cluster assembly protein